MTDKLQVLLIEDDDVDREAVHRLIGDEFRLLDAETAALGLKLYESQRPACVLLDFLLPDMDGMDVLDRLTEFQAPVVMLTGQGSEQIAVQAMKRGAQDYLSKQELTRDSLSRAVGNAITKVALQAKLVTKQKELEVARDAAHAASRAKSEFLANMSHEIRTPLNAVIGLTEVVLRTDLNETQHDYLSTVMDSAESLLTVINDILDFSKIEAGKLMLEHKSFNIHNTVGDTLRSLAIRAQKKDIELAYLIDPKLPYELIGDSARLRQVIANLVGNAIKFTEVGEVVVHVELEKENGFNQLRFSVRDTGIGIAAKNLDRLFAAFEQADASTTRRHGGTGLGLSVCRQLTKLMGGEIGAESVPGQGSTFYFTARFEVPDKIYTPQPTQVPRPGTRVLIVDDNPTNLQILFEITRARQMQPVLAESANDGFDILQEAYVSGDSIPLLVSDVHMPDVDGFMFVERIRQDTRFDDLKIIFLTSGEGTDDLQRCEELDVARRLKKPVKQSELFDVIVSALGASHHDSKVVTPADEDTQVVRIPAQRILLVEDSATNRMVALAFLKGHDHTVVVAEDGRQALDLLAAQEFDIVLMDVQMPEMDGIEATAAIRADEAATQRHIPIIAMTADALQGDREKCLAAGMDDYLAKPIRREELFPALARAVGLDSGGPPVAEEA